MGKQVKETNSRARVMAQRLRIQAAHMVAHNCPNSGSRESYGLFGLQAHQA